MLPFFSQENKTFHSNLLWLYGAIAKCCVLVHTIEKTSGVLKAKSNAISTLKITYYGSPA